MKLQVHLTSKDEESGEFSRAFVGHVSVAADYDYTSREGYLALRERACTELKDCYYSDFTSVKFTPAGVRVKLAGSIGEREQARLLRQSFDSMSRDEQDAYIGA